MTGPLLDVRELEVIFSQRGSHVRAVDRVSLSIAKGEVLGLVGESGSGKSTIGRVILGLTDATNGSVSFAGTNITSFRGRNRRALATDLQVVFQDPLSSLNPRWTVGRSLSEPLLLHRRLKGAAAGREVARLLASVGLPEEAANRMPRQLSGGQRQRIAIARAVALSPRLIVCDEPTSALDLSTQSQTLNLLRNLHQQHQLSYLFISHDLDVVRYISDRIAVLYRGQIMEIGEAVEVADSPQHPYTRALVGAASIPDPRAQAARRQGRQESTGQTTAKAGPFALEGCPFVPRCPFVAAICRSTRPALALTSTKRQVACHLFDPTSNHPQREARTIS